MKSLRVAMVAPPWLPIPPDGYGGIENVLKGLITHLRSQGTYVELFTTGDSTIEADKKHWVYDAGQYSQIQKVLYLSAPIQIAHVLHAINYIKADGKFDVVHDHNGFLGPLAYANIDKNFPPVLHTIHGPPFSPKENHLSADPSNLPMWKEIGKSPKNLFFVGISKALMKPAPKEMLRRTLPPVYNAIDVNDFPFVSKKKDYFITLARFHPDKGQSIAVEVCEALGLRLKMAGVVVDITTNRQVLLQLANPLSTYRGQEDFRYFSDKIFPHLLSGSIEYVGEVSGSNKLEFVSKAKALLFPIQWDEPFGMAPIEALACGTPVVAMARGALPEIIEHGVNGFLAKNKQEFKTYVKRIGDINPADCRRSVKKHFSAKVMAKEYHDRYKEAIKLAGR